MLLEVGPGETLSGLARHQADPGDEHVIVSSLPRATDRTPGLKVLLQALGTLWSRGVDIDWNGFSAAEHRRRVPLPTYPFERGRYWIDPPHIDASDAPDASGRARTTTEPSARGAIAAKSSDVATWFWLPTWRRTMPLVPAGDPVRTDRDGCWLVFADETGLGGPLARRLGAASQTVVSVVRGKRFGELANGQFAVRPDRATTTWPCWTPFGQRAACRTRSSTAGA